MQVIKSADGMQSFSEDCRKNGLSLGYVPTMGALHEGHLSLVRRSKEENDRTVVSIFVNPKQFNNQSDLKNYPRTENKDQDLLNSVHCDAVFIPEYHEVYPYEMPAPVDLGSLGQVLEASFRPGHFDGVTTVVKRLFELVRPNRAYFGQKDFQQLAVIRFMVSKLNLEVQVVSCPTSRNAEGLALSSRNLLLSDEEKKAALVFSRCLHWAQENIKDKSVAEIKRAVSSEFDKNDHCTLEYFEIADSKSLLPIDSWADQAGVVALIAGYVGKVRLIDNLILIP